MRIRAATEALVCAALCLGAATACGGTRTTDSATSSDTSTSSSPSQSGSARPTTDPSASGAGPTSPSVSSPASSRPTGPSGATATAGTPRPAPTGLAGRLLSAAEMPGFNRDYLWTAGRTAPENPSASFGTCQRFAITSIGAERALVRRFRPAAGDAAPADRAGQLVAEFPDAQTARRAYAVLKAWRARCADRLRGHTRPQVGALEDIPIGGGSGSWYLLTYGPVKGDPNARFFDAQGMAVVGSRIALVSMVAAGQDYNYPSGKEPAVTAVQRAGRKLS